MKITLIIIGIASVAFIAGFLLAAWVRQPDLDQARIDLELCRERETNLARVVAHLKQEMREMSKGLGAKIV